MLSLQHLQHHIDSNLLVDMASLRAASSRASSLFRTPITVRRTPPIVKPVALRVQRSAIISRSYASEAVSPVEAPDYLDEGERKIFDTIKQELQPTKLEVR